MPKIDVSKLETRKGSPMYPAPFQHICAGRHKTPLSSAAGITQFGVNLTRLEPGASTSVRHWHENEDEFVFVLMGECVLIENAGDTILGPGDCAGFRAGVANGHTIVNRSDSDVVLLEVGTRASSERAHYPGYDLKFERDGTNVRILHRDGTPY